MLAFLYAFAHRIYTSPLIYASCRDCPSYLASAEYVRDLLLPAETIVNEKWLPTETVRMILFPAETLCRKLNHTDSLCRKLLPSTTVWAGSKSSRTVSAEAKYDRQLCKKRELADSFTPCVTLLLHTASSTNLASHHRGREYLRLFPTKKYVTGCVSQCCIVGGNHGIYVMPSSVGPKSGANFPPTVA